MKEQLEYYIRSNLKNPIEEEIIEILDTFHIKEFQKGDHFKCHSEVCNKVGFLVEGSTKHYVLKKNGDEVTGRLTLKNNFISDIISVRTKGRTPISIQCLEPSIMLVTSVEKMEAQLEVNLTLNRLLREYIAESVVELGKLYMLFITGSAKERYEFILENNPSLVKNIPLRLIASMIGITPTQLSRIRNPKEK